MGLGVEMCAEAAFTLQMLKDQCCSDTAKCGPCTVLEGIPSTRGGHDRAGLVWLQVVIEVVDHKARPEVPSKEKLPGKQLCLHDQYIQLMEDCWAQDPTTRPSFETVIGRLR